MDPLLDNAPCGYLSFTDNGKVVSVNATLVNWLGYSKEDIIGKSVDVIFTLATRIFYNTHFFPLLKLHARADEIFLSLNTADKNDFPVLVNAERKLENDLHLNHCIFIPVRQRKKYEDEILIAKREAERALQENHELQELKNALEKKTFELDQLLQKQIANNKNLVQFSKIISHDLQEPIRKITLFTDLILKENKDVLSEKTIRAFRKIESAADRLRVLTTGLKQYLDVEAEQFRSHVDLNEVVRNTFDQVLKLRQIEGVDFICNLLPTIEGYRTQLQLMFFHLFDNSIQFQDQSRKLKIEIEGVIVEENIYRLATDKYRYVEHLQLTYKDNGKGFQNEYKDYVMELLKKIDSKATGLGIGLSLVRKIVDNHFGSVVVASEEGKGTEFTITIPIK